MRLIDADALANYANNQIVGITANEIMRFPTVDAEPVKHGEWVDVKFSKGVFKDIDESDDIGISITSAKCSLCQRYSEQLQQYRPKMPAYCSHCGAKMDLKDGESE